MDQYLEALPTMTPGAKVACIAFGLLAGILLLVAGWKILSKAGEPGWKAIIPFYNMYSMVKIADSSGWKFLLFLIPIVGFIYDIIYSIRLARAFGKGKGFGIGLFLLPNVLSLILGFGNAEYQGPKK